jgi:hypothetical protein
VSDLTSVPSRSTQRAGSVAISDGEAGMGKGVSFLLRM